MDKGIFAAEGRNKGMIKEGVVGKNIVILSNYYESRYFHFDLIYEKESSSIEPEVLNAQISSLGDEKC